MDETKRAWIESERVRRVDAIRGAANAFLDGASTFTLEIGCGHGRWLSTYAESHRSELCLGIDLITKRIEMGSQKKENRAIENVCFLKAECSEFLDAIEGLEGVKIKRCFMLFPDPWPKKRHHKKRMVQTPFLGKLSSLVEVDGWFCFRTDHVDYFHWTEALVDVHENWERIDAESHWPHENSSFFQDLLPEYRSLIARNLA
ncbi:MAG: tRNA (guanosine(46)-N7)-methyltransferase TrmB [Verrucomicrobiota bacterium]